MDHIWNSDNIPENIILITIDCLKENIVEKHLPTLQNLKSDGITGDCYTVGSGTTTAMPGIMQSRFTTDFESTPAENGLTKKSPTLAEQLSNLNVHCAGWHSNPYLDEFYGFHRGFDNYIDLQSEYSGSESKIVGGVPISSSVVQSIKKRSHQLGVQNVASGVYEQLATLGIVKRPRPYADARAVTDEMIDWLDRKTDSNTRFAWGHYMDVHTPFFPPEKYREMVSDCPESERRVRSLTYRNQWELSQDELQQLKGIYIACARYVDDQLSSVVDYLKDQEMWGSTMLIITADHGEMFGGRNVPGGKPFKHPGYLIEDQAAVPLAIAGGNVPSVALEPLVSTMDLAPTIVDLLNGDLPEPWRGAVIGSPEFTEREHIYGVTEVKEDDGKMSKGTLHVSVRTRDFAVLWWGHDSQTIEAYKRTDNGEVEIQSPTEHEECVRLGKVIESEFSTAANRCLSESTAGTDPGEEISARLRDLGYLN